MNSDAQTLADWVFTCLVIASLCTTAFPILYFFSGRWYDSHVGRAFLAQSIAFAVAMDLTLLFKFWHPRPPHIALAITAVALTFIAVTTAGLTGIMVRYNYMNNKESDEHDAVSEQQDV